MLEYSRGISGGALIFLRERVQKQRFFLDKKALENSMKRSRERWEAMTSYVNAEDCRTNYLLSYFGEHSDAPCGQCDICLGSREKGFSAKEKQLIEEKIKQILEEEKLSPRQIAYRFSYNLERKVLHLLEDLEQEGKVFVGNDKKVGWNR